MAALDYSLVPVSEIIVRDRHRKDLGNIPSLCMSIEEIGLLHPIVLTKKKQLLCGRRRLEAFKRLGRKEIPAVFAQTVDDILELTAERDENTCREDFKPSEAAALGKAIEQLERPKAKERQGRPNAARSVKFTEHKDRGDTRDKVGKAVGMSGPTFQRAKAVIEAAEIDPDTFGPIAEEMDRTGKVLPAFNRVQEIKRGKRPVPKEEPSNGAPNKRKPVGVIRANEAIDCLMRIPKNDPHRKRGFQIVTDWIKLNGKD